MIDKVKLMWNKEIFLGIIIKDGNKFSFERNTEFNNALKYPYDFYQKKNENLDKPVTSKQIETFFRERGIPENRQGIEVILQQLNLANYDYWELAKATESKDPDDRYTIEVI